MESFSAISKDLYELKLTQDSTREIFCKGTRDNKNLTVFRDKVSGIIYIQDYFVGEKEYEEGSYRQNSLKNNEIHPIKSINNHIPLPDYGRIRDLERRVNTFKNFFVCKDILDFGCGQGTFLIKTNSLTKRSIGIELEKDLRKGINAAGIKCSKDIDEIENESLDTIFLFHVFEHLYEPRKIMHKLYKKLKKGGKLILEVPHANDFLISTLREDSFIKFTLNSQHLILHTNKSLEVFLRDANFSEIIIKGVQRYPLSNHFNWLRNKKPGGHISNLAIIENRQLEEVYESSLSSINATDTLVAIATKN